ncbi:MAG: hypothetical protein PVI57_24355 [Gemmatimonadota bacterium]|jgi:hypothetical protein
MARPRLVPPIHVLLAVALFTLAPRGLAAQRCDTDNEYMELVRQQAVAAGDSFADAGYRVADMICGSLNEGGEGWFDTRMAVGHRIAFVAVCDQDCSDIDLSLYAGDLLIAEDVLQDDVPVIEIGPAVEGTDFRLKVSMYQCSTEPCYFGIAMFSDGG